jgi:translation initiation factor 2-alpha kinase 4
MSEFSQIALYSDPNVSQLTKDKKMSLLILVLLEIVFGNNSILFDKTVEYLIKTNLLDPDTQSSDFLGARTKLFNMIIKLNSSGSSQIVSGSNTNTSSNLTLINTYNKTFVEVKELGYGSFASVYKSQHKIDSKLYAIKKIIITDDLIDLGYDVFDEVKMLSSLDHPNVIRYYSSWVDFDVNSLLASKMIEDGSDSKSSSGYSNKSIESNQLNYPILFIQTELCDCTLKDYIDTKMEHDTIKQRIEYWRQMVQGIEYIHSQNIIHRDIKPSNIFFLGTCVKIGDFGLSKNISSFALQINKSVEIGTSYYRAPEIDSGDYTQSIDMYSLGVILIEMSLNCKTFFERVTTIKKIIETKNLDMINQKYTDLVVQLINKDPILRPNATQVLEQLNK